MSAAERVTATMSATAVASASATMSTTASTAAVSTGHLGHSQSDRRCDRAEFQSCSRRHDTPPNRKEIPNEIGSIAAGPAARLVTAPPCCRKDWLQFILAFST
jgi:hypothetical protein